MYKDIAKNLKKFVINYPQTIVPNPIDTDYQNGFIRRYFTRRANDEFGHIFEISEETYGQYIIDVFWISDTVKWRIAGPLEAAYKENGDIADKGVRDSNKAAMGHASKNLKNISLYLPNLLQFYKK
jgi:hypothetical protein